MELIFATGNKGKLHEAENILGERYTIKTPADFGITEDIEETGKTLEENSRIKARFIYERLGRDCFADDTGLEVDCLGGAPGVHSARYATDGHDFDANIRKLLSEMLKCGPGVSRRARFRAVVTLITDGEEHCFEGSMEGSIALEKSGTRGFGYDPVFIPDEYGGLTLSQVSEEEKNDISHRGKSLRAMMQWLDANK